MLVLPLGLTLIVITVPAGSVVKSGLKLNPVQVENRSFFHFLVLLHFREIGEG
jgi:hypothetical protein